MPFTPLNIPARTARVNTPQQRAQEPKTVGGFFKNVGSSGVDAVKGIGSSLINVFNPNVEKNTVANLAKLGVGAAQLLDPTQGNQVANTLISALPGAGNNFRQLGDQEEVARNVGRFYDSRYGLSDIFKGDFGSAKKKIGNTAYNDPVGTALDVSSVISGAGGLVKGAGTMGKSARLAELGGNIEKLDPLMLASKGTGKLFSKAMTKGGEFVENAGKDYAIKGYGQPGALAKYGEKYRPAQEVISDYGLYGKDTGKLADVTEKLQGSFDDIARNSGRQVDVMEILNEGLAKIEELKASGFPEDAALAQQMETRLSAFIDANPQMKVDIGKATEQRMGYDKRVKTFATDPVLKGANQNMRDLFQNQIRNAADGLVTPAGENLSATGKRLSELYAFQPIMEQAAARGTSTRPLSLGKMVTTGVGGAIAGIPGAVGAYGADVILNHPKVIGATSKALQTTGAAIKNGKIPTLFSEAATAGVRARQLTPPAPVPNIPNDYSTPTQMPVAPKTSGFKPLPMQMQPKTAGSKSKSLPTFKPLPAPKSNYNLGKANFNKVKKLTKSSSY